jgi:hypothetical protein
VRMLEFLRGERTPEHKQELTLGRLAHRRELVQEHKQELTMGRLVHRRELVQAEQLGWTRAQQRGIRQAHAHRL